MKTISSALRAHLDLETTTLTTCWYIRRTDGTEFFFTELPRDLTVDGDTYKASFGYTPSAVANNSDGAVDNLSVTGFIDDDDITERDLVAGLFNRAEFRIFMVNYDAPDDGVIPIKRGWLGDVKSSTIYQFQADLRSLAQALMQVVIGLYGPDCTADLGDSRCKVPIEPPVRGSSTAYTLGQFIRVATAGGSGYEPYANRIYECTTAGTTAASQPSYNTAVDATTTDGTAVFTAREAWTRSAVVATVTSRKQFTLTLTETRAVDDWFNLGALIWDSGDNVGIVCEVKDWVDSTNTVTLYMSTPFNVQVGDKLHIYPGCNKSADKTTGDCGNKFAIPGSKDFPIERGNAWNFRGFNKIPGLAIFLQTPTAQG